MSFSHIKSFVLPQGTKPSALTTGLAVFLTFMYILNFFVPVNKDFSLSPESLFKFQMSRLSLYPLVHLSLPHLLFNLLAMLAPLNRFEMSHGTVFTGVFLNMIAVFAAVPYCIVGRFLYPTVSVAGASGWCFSLFGYFSLKESITHPTYPLFGSQCHIPTQYSPLVPLFLIALLVPGSSFWGHLFGLLVGYAIAYRESWFIKITPPSWVIIKIETFLSKLIAIIPSFVQYYKEEETERHPEGYSSVFGNVHVLPITNESSVPSTGGRVLGTL